MLDHKLLKEARQAAEGIPKEAAPGIPKVAFNPMTPEAQAAAAQQGAAPPPAGAPPMDPSMMGGAPPMDPSMMGGAPPMDPSMMGMDPSMMGMDPAMLDPALGMEDPTQAPGGDSVTVSLDDLRQILAEAAGGGGAPEGGEEESTRTSNKDIMAEIQALKEGLNALAAAAGVQLPAGDVGAGGDLAPVPEGGDPADLAAATAADMGMMGMEDPMSQAMSMGLPPGEMPPGAMPKMASAKFIKTRLGNRG